MKKGLTSVIVLTCNRVERCLDSLNENRNALKELSTEWIVVNNGGADLPILSEVNLIEKSHNIGAAARNDALEYANGQYVLMLDDDAYIKGETVSTAIETLQHTSGASGVIIPVESEGCLLPTIYHGCAVLFSRKALNAIGGYPEDYLYYGEEYEVTFRLLEAGYSLVECPDTTPPVQHVRDQGGRNKNRIIRQLIRNNVCCWMRFLPHSTIVGAIHDTIHRYWHVAIKEHARRGFFRGLLSIPSALIRGHRTRTPLSFEQFSEIALNAEVSKIACTLHESGINTAVLCGLGKFASGWLRILRNNGLNVIAILEENTAFHGCKFHGLRVYPPEALYDLIDRHTAFITGTVSSPANYYWQSRLQSAEMICAPTKYSIQTWTMISKQKKERVSK